jgi:SAM-dependent methyltransferase
MRRLLVATLCGVARTLERGAAVSTYVAAGLLRFEALGRHAATNWRHYGVTQAEGDVADGLFNWERAFYGRFLRAGDRVLVVGCGGGRDLLPLLADGYRAEGLEPVAECAAMARERIARRGLTAEVYTGDVTTAALHGRYDAVIFSWLCYGYIARRARRVAALEKTREHLAAGGRVLISYPLAPAAPRRLPWRLARLAAWLSRADWRPEQGDVFIAWPDTGTIHYEHQFQPAEIEAEARAAGLAVAYHERTSDGMLALVPAATA